MAVSSVHLNVCIINGCGNKLGDPNISLFKIGKKVAKQIFALAERIDIGTSEEFISQLNYKEYQICSAHYDPHQFTQKLVTGAKPVRRLASQTPVMLSIPREVKGMLDSIFKTFTECSSDAGEIVIQLLHQKNEQLFERQTAHLPDYLKQFLKCLQGNEIGRLFDRLNLTSSRSSSNSEEEEQQQQRQQQWQQQQQQQQLQLQKLKLEIQQQWCQLKERLQLEPQLQQQQHQYENSQLQDLMLRHQEEHLQLQQQHQHQQLQHQQQKQQQQKKREREKGAIGKILEWFPLDDSTRRREEIEKMQLKIEETGEQVGNAMLGLYNGHQNFDCVMKFVEETIKISTKSDKIISLFICSPFYVGKLNSDFKPTEPCFKHLMNLILNALLQQNNLRVKFFSRSDHFSSAVNSTLNSQQREQLSQAKRNGRIEVLDTNVYVTKHYFHCKWLARVEESNVQLLMTSANVTDSHLLAGIQRDGYQQIDSMESKDICLTYFQVMFLIPILQVYYN